MRAAPLTPAGRPLFFGPATWAGAHVSIGTLMGIGGEDGTNVSDDRFDAFLADAERALGCGLVLIQQANLVPLEE